MIANRIVAASAVMGEVIAATDAAATRDIAVLIRGETGTGKELLAWRIHALSSRCNGPLRILNCASLPDGLVDRELFGHVRGAFSGADALSDGMMQAADGGTLVLDEVGELGQVAQAKLLRAIEEGEARRVGSTRTERLNVRFVSATNRDVQAAGTREPFRADLYYRLAGVVIEIPPLRNRPQDIPPLACHFLALHRADNPVVTEIEPAAIDALLGYAWPGNARELRNVIREAMARARSRLCKSDLPQRILGVASSGTYAIFDSFEREALRQLLDESHWDTARAADRAEVSRATLYRRMAKHGLRRPSSTELVTPRARITKKANGSQK